MCIRDSLNLGFGIDIEVKAVDQCLNLLLGLLLDVYKRQAYLPASRKLWLRAREESVEYPQELWITYLFDLDSGELRKVNEESFNIYE